MKMIYLLLAVFTVPAFAEVNPIAFVKSPYRSPEEASSQISKLANALDARGDHRAFFPHIYALTIRSAAQKLRAGAFYNPKWVRSLVVNYANLYRRTILLELSGRRQQLPSAWKLEFEYVDYASKFTGNDAYEPPQDRWSPDLDMVYGINVHIARDLVEALLITPTDFTSPEIKADYFEITIALGEAMPAIWQVYLANNRYIRLPDGFSQSLAYRWIASLRAGAWENALLYYRESPAAQAAALAKIDAQVRWQSKSHGVLLPLLSR